jgi:hypothetical protein
VVASAAADDDDVSDARARRTQAEVLALLASVPKVANEVLDWRHVNGQLHVWLAGAHNHPDSSAQVLFESLARLAPGSYGVMYSHDHDSEPGWTRRVMRRGGVLLLIDEDLSPHVGKVEDEAPPPT